MPKVNSQIWKQIPLTACKSDLKLALTQKAVVKVATAVVHSTQLILKASCHKQLHMDALILLGHASTDLSLRHRLAMRPYLNRNLTGLCSDTVPVTEQLFGDNLGASLKEVKGM